MALPLFSHFAPKIGLATQRKFRRWHRWLALVTAIQLLLWTLSGIFFAFVDINFVRGSDRLQVPAAVEFDLSKVDWVTDNGARIVLRHRLPGELVVGVVGPDNTNWYEQSGGSLADLTAAQALSIGAAATDLDPDRAVWVSEAQLGSEYRGRTLPLWRVFNESHPTTVAYIDAVSGEVVAIRNTAWRWWDFLWSLHIMDYDDRDTIGTVLLKIFSVLALLTAVAGIALFVSLPNKWR